MFGQKQHLLGDINNYVFFKLNSMKQTYEINLLHIKCFIDSVITQYYAVNVKQCCN